MDMGNIGRGDDHETAMAEICAPIQTLLTSFEDSLNAWVRQYVDNSCNLAQPSFLIINSSYVNYEIIVFLRIKILTKTITVRICTYLPG